MRSMTSRSNCAEVFVANGILKQSHILLCRWLPTYCPQQKPGAGPLQRLVHSIKASCRLDVLILTCYLTHLAMNLGMCSHIPPSSANGLYERDLSRCRIHRKFSLTACLPHISQKHSVNIFRDSAEL